MSKSTAPLLAEMFGDLNTRPKRKRYCHYVPWLRMTAVCGAYNPSEYCDSPTDKRITCPRCKAKIKEAK